MTNDEKKLDELNQSETFADFKRCFPTVAKVGYKKPLPEFTFDFPGLRKIQKVDEGCGDDWDRIG